jgi:hypothetical protein
LSCFFICFLFVPSSQAGFFSWFEQLWPKLPGPEDPHLYPEGSLLYDIWTCKGETEVGWVGVTDQFTDHDPYVVVVVRSEFPEQQQMHFQVGIEIIAPRHNMIICADRVNLEREQDIGIFYHPQDMARLGGWGEYKAVVVLDGVPKDVITFHLDQEEELQKKKAEEEMRKASLAAFEGSSDALEAKTLLGEPDTSSSESASNPRGATATEAPFNAPQIEVHHPDEWYQTRYEDTEGKIIMFPKKARRTWQENVVRDLRHRIQYYIFL